MNKKDPFFLPRGTGIKLWGSSQCVSEPLIPSDEETCSLENPPCKKEKKRYNKAAEGELVSPASSRLCCGTL